DARCAGHANIGFVGINDLTTRIGNDSTFWQRIHKRLRQILACVALFKANQAYRHAEQVKNPYHRQKAHQNQCEALPQALMEECMEDSSADKHDAEDQQSYARSGTVLWHEKRLLMVVVRLSRHQAHCPFVVAWCLWRKRLFPIISYSGGSASSFIKQNQHIPGYI